MRKTSNDNLIDKGLGINIIEQKIYYDVKQLAQLTSISKSLIYRLVDENNIPHIRLSKGKILFDINDVNAWLNKKKKVISKP